MPVVNLDMRVFWTGSSTLPRLHQKHIPFSVASSPTDGAFSLSSSLISVIPLRALVSAISKMGLKAGLGLMATMLYKLSRQGAVGVLIAG